ncbi:MAG TPA: SpoIIE family protein phosphatase [Limnobacter sp.]|nr:SpoIIE family protein phosphatase [Limnobacter sp.]
MDLTHAFASRAYPGEVECGDQAGFWALPHRLVMALADGLGHGAPAAHAAKLAIATVGLNAHYNSERIFEICNEQLINTRGSALTVAIVDLALNTLELGSVGNIRNRLLRDSGSQHLGNARGIVGAGYRRLLPEKVNLKTGDILVLFTDGFDELTNLRQCLPVNATAETVKHSADELLKTFARNSDDAGVLVYQHAAGHA